MESPLIGHGICNCLEVGAIVIVNNFSLYILILTNLKQMTDGSSLLDFAKCTPRNKILRG